jgi:hypothetical protein
MPLLTGRTFFTGLWGGEIWLPALGKLKLGTPLLFDIGVFLVVTGVAAKLLLVLLAQPKPATSATDHGKPAAHRHRHPVRLRLLSLHAPQHRARAARHHAFQPGANLLIFTAAGLSTGKPPIIAGTPPP